MKKFNRIEFSESDGIKRLDLIVTESGTSEQSMYSVDWTGDDIGMAARSLRLMAKHIEFEAAT